MNAPDQRFALWAWLRGIRRWAQVGDGTEDDMTRARLVAIAVADAFGLAGSAFMVSPALPFPTSDSDTCTVTVDLPAPSHEPYDGPAVDVWRSPGPDDEWELHRGPGGAVELWPPDDRIAVDLDVWTTFALAVLAARQPAQRLTPRQIADVAGHADPGTTLRVYAPGGAS